MQRSYPLFLQHEERERATSKLIDLYTQFICMCSVVLVWVLCEYLCVRGVEEVLHLHSLRCTPHLRRLCDDWVRGVETKATGPKIRRNGRSWKRKGLSRVPIRSMRWGRKQSVGSKKHRSDLSVSLEATSLSLSPVSICVGTGNSRICSLVTSMYPSFINIRLRRGRRQNCFGFPLQAWCWFAVCGRESAEVYVQEYHCYWRNAYQRNHHLEGRQGMLD